MVVIEARVRVTNSQGTGPGPNAKKTTTHTTIIIARVDIPAFSLKMKVNASTKKDKAIPNRRKRAKHQCECIKDVILMCTSMTNNSQGFATSAVHQLSDEQRNNDIDSANTRSGN